jgi:hypothetical protein
MPHQLAKNLASIMAPYSCAQPFGVMSADSCQAGMRIDARYVNKPLSATTACRKSTPASFGKASPGARRPRRSPDTWPLARERTRGNRAAADWARIRREAASKFCAGNPAKLRTHIALRGYCCSKLQSDRRDHSGLKRRDYRARSHLRVPPMAILRMAYSREGRRKNGATVSNA